MSSDAALAWRAASVVGLGFFPLAEGNVAVPVALALGIHPALAIVLSVAGTTLQTFLVRGLAGWLLAFPRVSAWWGRCTGGRVGRLFRGDHVLWVILIGIPWLGGVPTAFGSRLAGISTPRYARWAVGGLVLHASVVALLVVLGLHAVGHG